MSKIERLFFSIISEKNKGPITKLFRALLFLLSKAFQKVVACRTWCYKKNYISSFRPKAFTISIGNITCGGTGKTPLTIALAKEFCQDFQTAIVTRGYRSKIERNNSLKFIQNEVVSVDEVGDEACLYVRHVPKALIALGPKRKKAASMVDFPKSSVLLIDDGMQHHGILRDVEIVVIDAIQPFGTNHLLPRGTLREPLSSLARADVVVITRADTKKEYEDFKSCVEKYTKAPIFWAKTLLVNWRNQNNEICEINKHVKVGLFCGIGNPKGFFDFVQQQGLFSVATKTAQDHKGLSVDEVAKFFELAKAKGADILLCTEKDIVRFKNEFPFPVVWPEIHLEIEEKKEFQDLLSTWKKQITSRLVGCHEFL